jgi:hypothetical protein
VPSLAFVVLAVAIALLAMIPTRRLFLAGWSTAALTAYYLVVLALGLFVAELRGPARYLIPILVVIYIVPFITAKDGIARLRGRMGGTRPAPRGDPTAAGGTGRAEPKGRRPEPKNVTPKEARPPDAR